MTDIEDFTNDLYGAGLCVEDQDLRLLKAIVSDDKAARTLSSTYDDGLFLGDAKKFADEALGFYKSYNVVPTKRVMLDNAQGKDFFDQFTEIWERLDNIEYDKSEFSYDLDKVKDRFTRHEIIDLRDKLDETDLSDKKLERVLQNIRSKVDRTEKIRKGNALTYTQKTLKEYMPEFRDNFVLKSKNPDLGKGVLTGYSYIDFVTNGMSPSDMMIIGAQTGGGKALPLDVPIPTPDGMRAMGSLKPGDVVFGKNGKPCHIVAESQIYNDPGWEFTFNDGSSMISHDSHEWLTFNRKEQQYLHSRTSTARQKERERKGGTPKEWLRGKNSKLPPQGSIRTSNEIAKTIKYNNRNNHAIPLASPLELPSKELLIDPYLLGVWLGDGHALDGRITTADDEIIEAFVKKGYLQSKTYGNGKAKTYSF